MKKATKILLFCFAAICLSGFIDNVYALTAQKLWPVNSGNKWTYIIEGQINNGQKFTVQVTKRSGGWAYLEAKDKFYGADWGNRWWWMSNYNGSIWTWNPWSIYITKVFNLSVGMGNQFTSYIKDVPCLNTAVWTVTDDHATVKTLAGTFNDCVIIDNVTPPCVDAGLTRMVFAPDVGLVEYSWTTIAGGHTAKLIYALVDGIEYKPIEEKKGYSVGLNIDKIIYTLTENRMPPIPPEGPPKYPDTLNAAFKIENNTNQTITFHHTSSQEYDFVIRNDSGVEVYNWSHNKAFLTVLTDRQLAPGESLIYKESFDLRDNAGIPLPPGNYTIEAVHTTSVPALRQRAMATFTIELAIVE